MPVWSEYTASSAMEKGHECFTESVRPSSLREAALWYLLSAWKGQESIYNYIYHQCGINKELDRKSQHLALCSYWVSDADTLSLNNENSKNEFPHGIITHRDMYNCQKLDLTLTDNDYNLLCNVLRYGVLLKTLNVKLQTNNPRILNILIYFTNNCIINIIE